MYDTVLVGGSHDGERYRTKMDTIVMPIIEGPPLAFIEDKGPAVPPKYKTEVYRIAFNSGGVTMHLLEGFNPNLLLRKLISGYRKIGS